MQTNLRIAPGIAAVLLALLAFAAPPGAAQTPPRDAGPNILLIISDDHGYGDLSAYGGSDIRTPHLDALAAGGIRFQRFYANSSVCSPTRAALLSGRFPDLVGMPGVVRTHAANSWGYLAPDVLLLPDLLRRSGYQTAIVGKWHLGLESPNTPLERGFDHVYAFLGDMMDDFNHHRRHGINYMRRGVEEIQPVGHATDLFTDEAVRYIRERGASSAPFFLYLSYNAPHVPVQPPPEWVERVRRRQPGIDERRAALVAFIEHMDDGIGQVVRALRETGHYENTLIVFTADNGGEVPAGASNGPLRGTKTEMYEGGIRVPTIASWPGRVAPGTSDALLMSMDLYPTLAEAAGARYGRGIDGWSFLPILLGRAHDAPENRTLVWVRREGGSDMGLATYAIRRGDWKLLQNRPGQPFQLFNLRDDPLEQQDLARANPREFSELATELRAHTIRSGRVPWQPPN
jgi:arylsulfatase A-like enzyme